LGIAPPGWHYIAFFLRGEHDTGIRWLVEKDFIQENY
jgi:hypothetical protein